MFKNKKFAFYAVAFNILGIIFMFMYSGLQNDHYNIITAYSAWSASQIQLARTIAEFACIVLTFIYGTLFMKYGVRKTLIPCIMLCALGCVGITAANGLIVNGGVGNFLLFSISSFVLRCCCMCFQMAGFQLAANWFIKYRGRVLGIVTLGSPLFSVVGVGGMTNLIANNWNGDYRLFYIGISVILVAIAICTRFFLRDTPEEVGLYPDGADTAPKSEAGDDNINLTVKQILSEKRAWLLIVSYGAFQFIINCCMSSMAARFMSLDPAFQSGASPAPTVWLEATTWLSVGAILGIFMSYLFGWVDDKFGTIKASLLLGVTELIPVLMLMFMPEGGSIPMEIAWGFGVACMTGGVPTMHPCSVSYAYGRKEYQSANRIIMAIQLIPSAFAAYMMAAMIQNGNGVLAYGICVVVVIIGLIATWMMRKIPDAMAADRAFAQAEAAAE